MYIWSQSIQMNKTGLYLIPIPINIKKGNLNFKISEFIYNEGKVLDVVIKCFNKDIEFNIKAK